MPILQWVQLNGGVLQIINSTHKYIDWNMQIALVCNKVFGTDGISMFILNNHRYFSDKRNRYHLVYPRTRGDEKVIAAYLREFEHQENTTAHVSKDSGMIRFAISFLRYMNKNHIDILHVHGSSSAIVLEALLAKWGGVKVVVAHSHNTRGNHPLVHRLLRPLLNVTTDVRLACGRMAGEWMYGKNRTFRVIPNGIETNKYRYSTKTREIVRKELGITDDAVVIGHVGSFSEVKNQRFLIELIKGYAEDNNVRVKLLLIGDGILRQELEAECRHHQTSDMVVFAGVRKDVNRLMMAMDVFCLPSLYEGFPIVAVEAQASGLPVIMSSNISNEVCITDLVHSLPINKGIAEWKQTINVITSRNGLRAAYADEVRNAGYDIRHSAIMLESIYDKSFNGKHRADDLRRHRYDDSQLCNESG